MQSQDAVSAYFTSKEILPFVIAEQHSHTHSQLLYYTGLLTPWSTSLRLRTFELELVWA